MYSRVLLPFYLYTYSLESRRNRFTPGIFWQCNVWKIRCKIMLQYNVLTLQMRKIVSFYDTAWKSSFFVNHTFNFLTARCMLLFHIHGDNAHIQNNPERFNSTSDNAAEYCCWRLREEYCGGILLSCKKTKEICCTFFQRCDCYRWKHTLVLFHTGGILISL